MSDTDDDPVGGSDASDDDDDDNAGGGFDLVTTLANMSDAERKKWDKGSKTWRTFLDFLFRHVSIVTFKYNCFEREDLLPFMMALERAEDLRLKTTKLKKGETPRVASIREMKGAAELLTKSKYPAEATRIRRYLDLIGRMRGLASIASGLYKALRKGKVSGLDRIKRYVDYWKGFCVRSFDFVQLPLLNVDVSGLNELERKYLAWTAVIRTGLNLAERFLKRVCDSTGLQLLSENPATMKRHMQVAEFVLASKMEQLLFDKVLEETRALGILKGVGSLSFGSEPKDEMWDVPSLENVDPALLKPISDTSMLLELPPDPPKEKKLKKGKKGKGKKKGPGRSTSARPQKKKIK